MMAGKILTRHPSTGLLLFDSLDELGILLDHVYGGPLLYAHLTHLIGEMVQLLLLVVMFRVL